MSGRWDRVGSALEGATTFVRYLLPALLVLAAVLLGHVNVSLTNIVFAFLLFVVSAASGVVAVGIANRFLVKEEFASLHADHKLLVSDHVGSITAEVDKLAASLTSLADVLPPHITTPPPLADPAIQELVDSQVLMTDKQVAELEGGTAWYEVWVVTQDLHKDLPSADVEEQTFTGIVLANLAKGVRYLYFVRDEGLLKRNFRRCVQEPFHQVAPQYVKNLNPLWLSSASWAQVPYSVGDFALYFGDRTGTKVCAVLEIPQTRRRFWLYLTDDRLVRDWQRQLASVAEREGFQL